MSCYTGVTNMTKITHFLKKLYTAINQHFPQLLEKLHRAGSNSYVSDSYIIDQRLITGLMAPSLSVGKTLLAQPGLGPSAYEPETGRRAWQLLLRVCLLHPTLLVPTDFSPAFFLNHFACRAALGSG